MSNLGYWPIAILNRPVSDQCKRVFHTPSTLCALLFLRQGVATAEQSL
jgi:hypothetical protein